LDSALAEHTERDAGQETPRGPAAPSDQALATLPPPPPNADRILRPASGWSAIDLAEVWHFRDLLFTLAGRDLKLRYKQTALGVIWVVFQPLMAAGIFTVVFGKIAKLPSDGVPYFLFAFAGQLGWNLLNNTLTKSSGCLIGNAHLISKVFFPRLILPLSSIPSSFVDFAVALVMMAVMLACYGLMPGWQVMLLPLWMAILLAMAMGVGLISSALTVNYRDVQYILPVFMQMLLYASPVAYGVSSVPASIKPFYYVNPVSPVLEGFRWSLLNTSMPDWRFVGYSAAMAVALLVSGAFAFKRMERRFADVI
jgi:lipopolysaccharide transport system permease protein